MSLTRFPTATFRELLAISLPLMLSSFSFSAMLFIDRLFLAHFSLDALNSVSTAITLGWAIIVLVLNCSAITEVFVAQRNGAQRYTEIGEPVWQMLWFSLFSILYFVPLGMWLPELIYGEGVIPSYSKEYLRWLLLFGPFFTANAAVSAFYIGRGNLKEVTILSVLSNVVNIVLDWLLIFGVKGLWEPMGVKGAAIATGLGGMFPFLVLFTLFLRKEAREKYGTGRFTFRWPLFWDCFRVGLPSAIFVGIEILGFSLYFFILASKGKDYLTVGTICHSFITFLWFFIEGTHVGIKTVVGNLIGARQIDQVRRVLRHGMILHLGFALFLLVIFFLFSDTLILLLIPNNEADVLPALHSTIYLSLFLTIFYMLGEGIRLVFAGVLTAAGDTKFLMGASILACWGLLVIPVYWAIIIKDSPIVMGTVLCSAYSVAATVIYFLRFLSGRWKGKQLEQAATDSIAMAN